MRRGRRRFCGANGCSTICLAPSSTATAAGRPGAEGQHGGRQPVGAQPAGRAPEQRRSAPSCHNLMDPGRALAREVRCRRSAADGRGRRRRSMPPAAFPTAAQVRRRRRTGNGASAPAGAVRRRVHREASHLCVGAGSRVLRCARCSSDRAARRAAQDYRMSSIILGVVNSQPLPDEEVAMIITKKALPRRTFLRGMGASVALPLLDAMVPSMTAFAKTPAAPVRRLGFVYMPMGCDIARWTPPGDGKLTDLSPTLQSLAPCCRSADGHHESGAEERVSRHACDLERGVPQRRKGEVDREHGLFPRHDGRSDCRASRSDARRCCRRSSCRWTCSRPSGSATTATRASIRTTSRGRPRRRRCPSEAHPRIVFERLFGEGGSAADRQRGAAEASQPARFGAATTSARLQNEAGAGGSHEGRAVSRDRSRGRAPHSEGRSRGERRPRCRISIGPSGVPAAYADHAKLMFDLQVLAMQGDVTRVITFQLARETSNAHVREIGVPDPHHPLTHHGNDPEKIARMAKINAFHVSLFAYFLEKLKSTPEGDGSAARPFALSVRQRHGQSRTSTIT